MCVPATGTAVSWCLVSVQFAQLSDMPGLQMHRYMPMINLIVHTKRSNAATAATVTCYLIFSSVAFALLGFDGNESGGFHYH